MNGLFYVSVSGYLANTRRSYSKKMTFPNDVITRIYRLWSISQWQFLHSAIRLDSALILLSIAVSLNSEMAFMCAISTCLL
jgi:hypothetical protein